MRFQLLHHRHVSTIVSSLAVSAFLVCVLGASAQGAAPAIKHVERMPNTANPELLYWFISPREITDKKYRQEIDDIAAQGTFDFVFLTARNGANFYDYEKMHPIFKDLVQYAHSKGLKVGLQLWSKDKDVPADQVQGLVTEQEMVLDAAGKGMCTGHLRGVRMSKPVEYQAQPGDTHPQTKPVRSELLRVYVFKKTGDGTYAPGSVIDLTAKATTSSPDAASVSVQIDGGAKLAGYNVYVMTLHYVAFPDLFTSYLPDTFERTMKTYQDVDFNGAALDEFRYVTVGKGTKEDFRERLYTPAMEAYFKQHSGRELARSLFDMRYAPADDVTPRVWAIDHYFQTLREGPLHVEEKFADATTRILGPAAFHGIHDTFHNGLEGDEVWETGVNWWSIPRDYGQTDETTPMTTRLGIGMAHAKPVEYNQYYTKDQRRFLQEGIDDARYNVRVHYHAWNDEQGWGIDLRSTEMEQKIGAVENKVRLLNQFGASRPAVNVLYVFGFPSLLNWLQPGGERNAWDINGALQAEQKAVDGWNAGYRGVLVPSDLIDAGKIVSDGNGGVLYGGRRFRAMVYFGPEYSTTASLKLLESFVATGGKLLLDGVATRDFDGGDIKGRFGSIAAKAVGTTFAVDAMSKLGVPALALEGGARFEDGSVVLTDLDSVLTGSPLPFTVTLGSHTFTGSYVGLMALKADDAGHVVKLAAGGLQELKRDGVPLVELSKPADVVLDRAKDGGYSGTVVGDATVRMP